MFTKRNALTQVEICWVYGLHKIQMKMTKFYLVVRYIIPHVHLRIEVNLTFIKSTAFHVKESSNPSTALAYNSLRPKMNNCKKQTVYLSWGFKRLPLNPTPS